MATEIELKFLVLTDNLTSDGQLIENISKNIQQLIKDTKTPFEYQIKHLTNCYFDTTEHALRALDFGLRVRQDNDSIEQTIKTAGVVIGGLHQRPEYNVKLVKNVPDLSLFPSSIWPQTHLPKHIQPLLLPLFNTDFNREIWQVNYQNSLIEIAFDHGKITSSGQSVPICEIELEIIKGEIPALFGLAGLLFNTIKVRPGVDSKAKRGYALYNKKSQLTQPLDFEIINHSQAASQGQEPLELTSHFVIGVAVYLQQLQRAVSIYVDNPLLKGLIDIVKALRLLQHGFWLFESQLVHSCVEIKDDINHFLQLFCWVDNAIYLQELMNNTGNYRNKLNYSKALIAQLKLEKKRFPDSAMVINLLHSERFNQFQMKLVALAINKKSNSVQDKQGYDALISFAQVKLSDSLAQLKQVIPPGRLNNAEQVLPIQKFLQTSLLTGYWFGGLFDKVQRHQFRMPWLDIEQGITELQSLWIIEQQLEKLAEPAEKIVRWQHGKVENLLTAVEQSKVVALSMTPYWYS